MTARSTRSATWAGVRVRPISVTSSGLDSRSGFRSSAGRLRSLSRMAVATPIGQSTLTPMLYGRRSFCSVSERPTTAYFVVL